MSRLDRATAESVDAALSRFETEVAVLPGIASVEQRDALVRQIVDSGRRNRFVQYISSRELSPARMDPNSGAFDPLRAAVLFHRHGETDEAFWMLFLFVHFGKHRRSGWRYATNVYGQLGAGGRWDWQSVSHDVAGFRDWLDANKVAIAGLPPRGFGNHRKYESLAGWTEKGTGAVVASYVDWVGQSLTHQVRFDSAITAAGGVPTKAFDDLYHSMADIRRFGRVARFDYLSMARKLGLAPIVPRRAYLVNSTGPLKGARLLFGAAPTALSDRDLDNKLVELEQHVHVGFDVLEDALCNWQKNPTVFRPFRG